MKKEEIRKEYFKLRIKGHTNNQCRKILFAKFNYEINIRTLRRWTKKLNETEWDLKDNSKRQERKKELEIQILKDSPLILRARAKGFRYN